MITSKKTISLFLAFVMILGVCAPAFAEETAEESQEPVFANTKAFLAALAEVGDINYVVTGIDEDIVGNKMETVIINFEEDDDSIPLSVAVLFPESNDGIFFRVYDLYRFDDSDKQEVLLKVNAMNAGYNWVKIYLDNVLGTVMVESDVMVNEDCAAEFGMLGLAHVLSIAEEAWEILDETEN